MSSRPRRDPSRGQGTRSAGTRRALTRSRRRRRRRQAAPAGRAWPGPARARGAWCRRRVPSRISSRHSALVAPPPAARGALNPGGAERERPGEGAWQPASPSPHRLRRALPAPLWEGPEADHAPPQVSAHLEPRPLRQRGRNVRNPGPGEGWESRRCRLRDATSPRRDARVRDLCLDLDSGNWGDLPGLYSKSLWSSRSCRAAFFAQGFGRL